MYTQTATHKIFTQNISVYDDDATTQSLMIILLYIITTKIITFILFEFYKIRNELEEIQTPTDEKYIFTSVETPAKTQSGT